MKRSNEITQMLINERAYQKDNLPKSSGEALWTQLVEALGAEDSIHALLIIRGMLYVEEYLESIDESFDEVRLHLGKIERLRYNRDGLE
jgi:hypothetical protein